MTCTRSSQTKKPSMGRGGAHEALAPPKKILAIDDFQGGRSKFLSRDVDTESLSTHVPVDGPRPMHMQMSLNGVSI